MVRRVVAVFGILKRSGVYTNVVENTKQDTLLPVIKRKKSCLTASFIRIVTKAMMYLMSEFTHHRINHSQLFADRQNHINGIENFLESGKARSTKYNGIDRKFFPLFLKE